MERENFNTDYLCEVTLRKRNPELHSCYAGCVMEFDKKLERYHENFPDFTDHTLCHSMYVQDICNKLISENIQKMNDSEIYIILMASLFHDIGMGTDSAEFSEYRNHPQIKKYIHLHPEKTEKDIIRDFHHDFSYEYVMKYWRDFNVPDIDYAKATAFVSRGHRKVSLYSEKDGMADFFIQSSKEIVSIPYMSALIRLSDEFDVVSERVRDYQFDGVVISPAAMVEHTKHRAIKRAEIIDDRFVMYAECDDENIKNELEKMRSKIEKIIVQCREVVNTHTRFTLNIRDCEILYI